MKEMHHACEAETSLMLHLHAGLVRMDLAVNDGLRPEPSVIGLVSNWDQVSEQGPLGYPTFATAKTGRKLFEACVAGMLGQVKALRAGIVYAGIASGHTGE